MQLRSLSWPTGRVAVRWRQWVAGDSGQVGLGLIVFLLARPLLAIVREAAVIGLAALLGRLATASFWPTLIGLLPVDPVYTLALVRFGGEIEASGLALAGPLGSLLAQFAPDYFLAAGDGDRAWVSAMLEPGATAVARGLVELGADVLMLGIAVGTLRVGLRGRRWLVVAAVLQQAHLLVFHFVGRELSLREVEAAGLPFALSTLFSGPAQRAPWFTAELSSLPEAQISLLAGVLLAGLAYLLIGLLLAGAGLAATCVRRWRGRSPGGGPAVGWGCARARFGLLLLALIAATPLGALADSETRVLADTRGAGVARRQSRAPAAAAVVPSQSRQVTFVGQAYDYRLIVDGESQIVRGMGYNVQYHDLPEDERRRLYDRDFDQIRSVGVNVIFGWFESEFDQTMLDAAFRHGLGVGVPFELNQDLDYDDPNVRERLKRGLLDQVSRYKSHPAVWFWTPGNEVIHRLIFPSWLRHERDLVREARADSFARFYVELIDAVHSADPAHPVVYRDAEEVYLGRVRDELRRDGVARPWFAYGANVYTQRLGEILANWPLQGLEAPLLVSEYAPGGTGPAGRAEGLRRMWQTIQSYPRWVIGGAVYTWSTDGPEELDRVFGLVDGQGVARDGALASIAELYGGAVIAGGDPGGGW